MIAPTVDRARGTLFAGTRFLSLRAERGWLATSGDPDGAAEIRTRHLGNCLAELDRFLHVLMDTLDPAAPHGRHNAANKLAALRGDEGEPGGDGGRLRALGRSRACLRYCNGAVLRPDAPGLAWMTTGWTDPSTNALRRYDLGQRLALESRDMLDICRFYEALATDLIGGRA
ncbi:hypothetical protein [Sphingomonas aracearum]|uniref:Uncharacterized protein n=1 Tax=Sphingomonas aracearum TaxID=2283317 RepID=A0A369VUK1_9SPHN|nr:hypothetical protein [Sphingomonas aracearum]RDE05763.1 hypothetical protein DVW87_11215 [Sphingomonas aracearum]